MQLRKLNRRLIAAQSGPRPRIRIARSKAQANRLRAKGFRLISAAHSRWIFEEML